MTTFIEIFVMPQQIVYGNNKVIWKVLVKNASSCLVYLNSYTLNSFTRHIGSTPIPNNADSWFAIPITKNVQDNGSLVLTIDFEDYLGNKYRTKSSGEYLDGHWNLCQFKREKLI